MGSRGGFDNAMAGGCTPLRGVDAVDVKIKLRADPSSPPDACSHEWAPISRWGDASVCLFPARPRTAGHCSRPCTRIRLRIRSCRFWGSSMNMTPKKAACVVICAILLATLGAGCTQLSSNQTTQSGGITVTDDAGRTVTVAQTPHRIISLAPSITEDLFALGLGGKVVGDTTYDNYPPAAVNITKVGGFSSPSIEKIVSLNPDIVFASSLENNTLLSTLSGYGIPTVVINPTSLTGILNDLSLIGKVTGSTGNSSALVANLTQKMTANSISVASHPRVLYLVWYDPIMSAGADTFEGDIIAHAGGINVAQLANVSGYGTMSKESIVALNPSVIIANSAMNSTAVQQVKSDPALATVDAVKNGKIYILDSDIISRPGPRAFDALEQIAGIIRQAS